MKIEKSSPQAMDKICFLLKKLILCGVLICLLDSTPSCPCEFDPNPNNSPFAFWSKFKRFYSNEQMYESFHMKQRKFLLKKRIPIQYILVDLSNFQFPIVHLNYLQSHKVYCLFDEITMLVT
jgi:hypothetical protein